MFILFSDYNYVSGEFIFILYFEFIIILYHITTLLIFLLIYITLYHMLIVFSCLLGLVLIEIVNEQCNFNFLQCDTIIN